MVAHIWKHNTKLSKHNTKYSLLAQRSGNSSINSEGAHPLPGNHGAFALVISPGGGGIRNFIAARGDPEAFDTGVSERWMSLSGRRPLSKTGLSVRD